jgi:hypothetical protein
MYKSPSVAGWAEMYKGGKSDIYLKKRSKNSRKTMEINGDYIPEECIDGIV